jgi:hypothetical protein
MMNGAEIENLRCRLAEFEEENAHLMEQEQTLSAQVRRSGFW